MATHALKGPRKAFHVLLVTLLAAGSVTASSDRVYRILWVGNSLTFRNDLPGLTQKVAAQAGVKVIHNQTTPEGWLLLKHAWANSTFRQMLNCQVLAHTAGATAYDYVVIQDESQVTGGGRVTDVAMQIPDLGTAFGLTVPLLASTIAPCVFGHNQSSGAKVVLYQTWGRINGDVTNADIYPTFERESRLIAMGYEEYATQLRAVGGVDAVLMARVGDARMNVWATEPEYHARLYADGKHPTLLAAYLGACVFVSTLWPDVPLPVWKPPNIAQHDAFRMRAIVRRTKGETSKEKEAALLNTATVAVAASASLEQLASSPSLVRRHAKLELMATAS